MTKLQIWFFNVGHGDCSYIEMPNGARIMIDCGGYNNSPSKLLKHFGITKKRSPVPIPDMPSKYALDCLVISHPHGDHISDIVAIHDEIGFYLLTGNYRDFIDEIGTEKIDFRKRGQEAAKKFIDVVKSYIGEYVKDRDRVQQNTPECIVKKKRFLGYEDGMDLNDLSWLVSFEIGGHKVLFTGDMTAAGVRKILKSSLRGDFNNFVKGTTILKIPHHGRENGCSNEMFECFGTKPLLCIASDEILNDRNEGTSNIQWYTGKTSDKKISIDGKLQSRKVLTTRNDKDIYLCISDEGNIEVNTNAFQQ